MSFMRGLHGHGAGSLMLVGLQKFLALFLREFLDGPPMTATAFERSFLTGQGRGRV